MPTILSLSAAKLGCAIVTAPTAIAPTMNALTILGFIFAPVRFVRSESANKEIV
jgi:hypothetical protein